MDTAYKVAGIRVFVVRAESMVSQDVVYFFFDSLVRGVRGSSSDTDGRGRPGFLQDSRVPSAGKVSRSLARRITRGLDISRRDEVHTLDRLQS